MNSKMEGRKKSASLQRVKSSVCLLIFPSVVFTYMNVFLSLAYAYTLPFISCFLIIDSKLHNYKGKKMIFA